MPQAVPAIIVAAGQTVVVGAITAKIVAAFVINVALSGFEFNEKGERWVALKRA